MIMYYTLKLLIILNHRHSERLKMIGESIVIADADSNTAGTRTAHRVHFLKTAWFRYAAIFILAIGITDILFCKYL